MTTVLIFGKGLLGFYVNEYLSKYFKTICLERKDFEVTQESLDKLESVIDTYKPTHVINCIGVTNVSKVPFYSSNTETAKKVERDYFFLVNSTFPQRLVSVCQQKNIICCHISTDCVFNGKSLLSYTENSAPDAIDIYSLSKSRGEKGLFFRCSFIGLSNRVDDTDFISFVRRNHNNPECISGYTNHHWNGITCLEYAKFLRRFISSKELLGGCIHLVPEYKLTKYKMIIDVSKVFGYNIKVKPTLTTQDRNMILDTKYDRMITTSWEVQLEELFQFHFSLNNLLPASPASPVSPASSVLPASPIQTTNVAASIASCTASSYFVPSVVLNTSPSSSAAPSTVLNTSAAPTILNTSASSAAPTIVKMSSTASGITNPLRPSSSLGVKKEDYTMFDRILIFGGTGSLGRALIKKWLVSPFESKEVTPSKIAAFSRTELRHWELDNDVGAGKVQHYYGDIANIDSVRNCIHNFLPSLIIVASAMKHINICQTQVWSCLETNVKGLHNVLQVVEEHHSYTKNFAPVKIVFVSTDKACDPCNIYGMSKYMSENIVKNRTSPSYVLSAVRYGNVLNTSGSIIPLFNQQSRESLFFTITDNRMTRFIMHLSQSIDLIRDAAWKANSGEIFIPLLKGMRVHDLSILYSARHKKPVKTIGIRQGEKLHEALLSDTEYNYVIDYVINKNHRYVVTSNYLSYHNRNNYLSNSFLISPEELQREIEPYM